MKEKIKSVFPPTIVNKIRKIYNLKILISCYLYDYRKFVKYSGNFIDSYKVNESWIIQFCHSLEKGLTNTNIRFDFGHNAIDIILKNYNQLKLINKLDPEIEYMIADVFYMYDKKHKDNNKDYLYEFNNDFLALIQLSNLSEYNEIFIKKIDYSKFTFEELMMSRKSVRQYSNKKVSFQEIKKAIDIAKYSPSVCNRQHFRVKIFDGEKKNEFLSNQNGNITFRSQINQILVVTSDLNYMVTPLERYQQYIDGGIFLGNLINSLQVSNIYSCVLNWAADPENDKKIYKSKLIPNNEAIIAIIAIGDLESDSVVVCESRRFSTPRFLNNEM